jgi:hypothetical protein
MRRRLGTQIIGRSRNAAQTENEVSDGGCGLARPASLSPPAARRGRAASWPRRDCAHHNTPASAIVLRNLNNDDETRLDDLKAWIVILYDVGRTHVPCKCGFGAGFGRDRQPRMLGWRRLARKVFYYANQNALAAGKKTKANHLEKQ